MAYDKFLRQRAARKRGHRLLNGTPTNSEQKRWVLEFCCCCCRQFGTVWWLLWHTGAHTQKDDVASESALDRLPLSHAWPCKGATLQQLQPKGVEGIGGIGGIGGMKGNPLPIWGISLSWCVFVKICELKVGTKREYTFDTHSVSPRITKKISPSQQGEKKNRGFVRTTKKEGQKQGRWGRCVQSEIMLNNITFPVPFLCITQSMWGKCRSARSVRLWVLWVPILVSTKMKTLYRLFIF